MGFTVADSAHNSNSINCRYHIRQQKFESFWPKNKSQHWTTPHTRQICLPPPSSSRKRSCSWRVQNLIQRKRFRKPWPTN